MLNAIYEPKGKALEYGKYAVNLYRGCSHACRYCYVPAVTRNNDFRSASPRTGILEQLQKDCAKLSPCETVFLCFTCDPYQPAEAECQLTRHAIQILHNNFLYVNVLSKGGKLALRDLELFTPNDMYGITLTDIDSSISQEQEPGAAPSAERIETLREFHNRGIKTWVSLEPVLSPEKSLEVIKTTHEFTGIFKVGKLNHNSAIEKQIDWHKFAHDAITLLEGLNKTYYIKQDLQKFIS